MTMPTGGMSLKDIRDDLVDHRFGPSMDASLNHWINLRYGIVWNDSEWPFRLVRRESRTATSGELELPAEFARATMLERSDGAEVAYLAPDQYNRYFPVNDTSTGNAEYYTVSDGRLYLAAGDGSYSLSYERGFCHFNAAGTLTPGLLDLDGDYPVWLPEFHYILVVGAMATGLKIQNDPTWDALEQEFGVLLGQMREALLPPDLYGTTQYGRDTLD